MKKKKLVICCDGTWNTADQERQGAPCPTNVAKTAYRVAKRDAQGTPQVIFYDHGVGTGNALDRLSGGAFGHGLEDNIHAAYRFLVANYEPGDRLYLFGFSRGAFTVRSLIGMIRNCGILARPSIAHYRNAVALYRDKLRHPDHDDSKRFREHHSVCGDEIVPIHFLGVWDTVGSLGIPLRGLRRLTRGKYQFHDAELSGTVRNAFHALAVDERRAPFEPAIWEFVPKEGQHVEQVWFCGAHSDVGGGYPETGLSDIALDWMLDKAGAAGLHFDPPTVAAYPTKPDPLGTLHNSKKGLYRLTPGIDRPIGRLTNKAGGTRDAPGRDPTQSVHDSVLARWDADVSYRPRSLRAFLKDIDDPRGL